MVEFGCEFYVLNFLFQVLFRGVKNLSLVCTQHYYIHASSIITIHASMSIIYNIKNLLILLLSKNCEWILKRIEGNNRNISDVDIGVRSVPDCAAAVGRTSLPIGRKKSVINKILLPFCN